jgi:hypothetical protein
MTSLASEAIDARRGDCVRSIAGFRGVRPDPDETPEDRKLIGFWMILDRVIKYLIEWLIGWRMAPQTLSHGGSTITPRCRHRVGTE